MLAGARGHKYRPLPVVPIDHDARDTVSPTLRRASASSGRATTTSTLRYRPGNASCPETRRSISDSSGAGRRSADPRDEADGAPRGGAGRWWSDHGVRLFRGRHDARESGHLPAELADDDEARPSRRSKFRSKSTEPSNEGAPMTRLRLVLAAPRSPPPPAARTRSRSPRVARPTPPPQAPFLRSPPAPALQPRRGGRAPVTPGRQSDLLRLRLRGAPRRRPARAAERGQPVGPAAGAVRVEGKLRRGRHDRVQHRARRAAGARGEGVPRAPRRPVEGDRDGELRSQRPRFAGHDEPRTRGIVVTYCGVSRWIRRRRRRRSSCRASGG